MTVFTPAVMDSSGVVCGCEKKKGSLHWGEVVGARHIEEITHINQANHLLGGWKCTADLVAAQQSKVLLGWVSRSKSKKR